jgi:5-methylcytosine-specific restriction endonuclease McrA
MDKKCIDCLEIKDVSMFYPRKDKGPGFYRNTCKPCLSKKTYKKLKSPRIKYLSKEERRKAAAERAKEWYKNNTERAKANVKNYYSTDIGIAKRKASLANRKLRNPDYWRVKKKRDKVIRRSREYLAGPLEASAIITLEAYNLKQFSANEFVCEFCGKELGFDYHLEHLTPLSRGGSNDIKNLGISCEKCNLTKSSKTVEEFSFDKLSYFKNRNI